MEQLFQNPYIQLAIHLQLSRLQREQLASLTYQHLEDTLRVNPRSVSSRC